MQGTWGSIPGRGTKIPHAAAGHLSPPATTSEPSRARAHTQLESPRARTEPSHGNQREARVMQQKIPRAPTKTRRSQIN